MGKSLKHLTTVQTSSFWSPWHVDTLATSSTLDIARFFFCYFEHISYFCYFCCIAYLGYFYIVYVFFFRLFFLQYLPFTSLIYMLSYIPLILMYHPISFSSLQLLLSLILIDIYIISPFFFFANISALSPITAISVVSPIPPCHFSITICSYWYSCTIASSCLISLSYPPSGLIFMHHHPSLLSFLCPLGWHLNGIASFCWSKCDAIVPDVEAW